MLVKRRITYTVKMQCEVSYDPEKDDFQDVICDIDIPEGGKHDSQYVDDSFEICEVETLEGRVCHKETGEPRQRQAQ